MQFPDEATAIVWSMAGIVITLTVINPVLTLGLLAVATAALLLRRRG